MSGDGGLAKFQRRMRAVPRAAARILPRALTQSAEEVAAAQRALAPEDEGNLKASIAVTGPGEQTPPYSQPGGSMTVPPNAAAVTVGNSDVRYPHLQEFGTSFHPAQPFFWPGFRLTRKRAANRIKRAIAKAVREAK